MNVSTNYRNSFAISLFQKEYSKAITVFLISFLFRKKRRRRKWKMKI